VERALEGKREEKQSLKKERKSPRPPPLFSRYREKRKNLEKKEKKEKI